MKTFVLAIQEGPRWACDNICSDIINFSQDFGQSLEECKSIWLLSNWQWSAIPKNYLSQKKVVCTIHHIVEEKFNKLEFKSRDEFVDVYHVPCQLTKDSLSKYTTKTIEVLPYWYNEELWYKQENSKELKDKYNLPKNKLLFGSFQRDTEGGDLKSPKLEKGPDLFCDIVENLEAKPHIILTGWRREYILNRLNDKKISYSYFEMADAKTINDLYNCLDYYLITSRVEGGPQALLEGGACGTKILSTKVGMATQVLSPESICKDKDEFIRKINLKTRGDSLHEDFEMKKVLPRYFEFFDNL